MFNAVHLEGQYSTYHNLNFAAESRNELTLAGPLSEVFGVCANGNANDDGRVVSFDHGCGGHSEVQIAAKSLPAPPPDPFLDEITVDGLESF